MQNATCTVFQWKRVDYAKMQPTSIFQFYTLYSNIAQLIFSHKGEKNSFRLAPYLLSQNVTSQHSCISFASHHYHGFVRSTGLVAGTALLFPVLLCLLPKLYGVKHPRSCIIEQAYCTPITPFSSLHVTVLGRIADRARTRLVDVRRVTRAYQQIVALQIVPLKC